MRLKVAGSILGGALCLGFVAGPAAADHHTEKAAAPAKANTAQGAPQAAAPQGSQQAAPQGQMDEKSMIEAMEKASAPTAEHETLKKLAGTWNAKVTSWMDPSKDPKESKAKVKAKAVLGGRFIEEAFDGKWGDKPFHGMGLIGYDKAQKKYVSTWVDSMATSVMVAYGTADPTGKVITSTAEVIDPATGQKSSVRMVRRIESDTKNVFEFYSKGPDGKEFKGMEIVYSKK